MSIRIRVVAVLVGLVAAAGALAAGNAQAASIVLALNADHTLEVRVSTGVRIRTSGAPVVLAPGVYEAVVISEVPEFRDDYHMFHLVGPGVNLQTDLLAGDERAEPHTISLQASSVYTFRDERNLGLGSVVFSTSGSGTEVARTSGGSSGGGSSGGTTSNTPGSQTTNKDTVGSKALPLRGSLTGNVSTAGRLSLQFKGKAVNSLKAGRYTISVLDETSKSAFVLQRLKQQPRTLSSKDHVGRKTVTMSLNAGQWMFYSSPGKKSYFVVTS